MKGESNSLCISVAAIYSSSCEVTKCMPEKSSQSNIFPFEEKMRLAQQGDQAAYTAVLMEMTPLLRAFISKRLSDHGLVEDIVQEILISIHKARHTYEPSRPFLPWMFAIAHFRLTDHFRRSYRQHAYQMVDFEEVKEHLVDTDVTEAPGDYELLDRALASLPPKQRSVIMMMYSEGYTTNEVAEKLGMTQSAVKVTAHRAYKFLRKKFEGGE